MVICLQTSRITHIRLKSRINGKAAILVASTLNSTPMNETVVPLGHRSKTTNLLRHSWESETTVNMTNRMEHVAWGLMLMKALPSGLTEATRDYCQITAVKTYVKRILPKISNNGAKSNRCADHPR
jgi:hypothetical protein